MPQWKNFLILPLVRLLQSFQKKGDPNHFIIVSTTGLGDTLWATPAIRALKEAHPNAYIGCLTTPLGKTVLSKNPYIDEFFVFKNILFLYFQLRKRNIGTVLLFHTSQRAVLPLCSIIGATKIIGTKGLQKGLDALLTQSIPWNMRSHEIERRLDLVRAVGANPASYDLEYFDAAEMESNEFVIGLHPGAKDKFKQWPPAYFIEVGKRLRKELGAQIVVTGTPNEKELVDSISKQIDGAKSIIEPLQRMAGRLKTMSLFITNDTGPLHLALAMKTRTLSFFVPTNPAICGPYHNETAIVLSAPPTCFPCLKKKCRDPFCMRQIKIEDVVHAALEVFACR